MVAGKVKETIGLQRPQRTQKSAEIASRKQNPLPLHPPPLPLPPSSKTVFSRSFGVYFPRATAQVQPRPPDVSELLKIIEDLRDRESRLTTQLLEQKLVNESAEVLQKLEMEIRKKDLEIEKGAERVEKLETENRRINGEVEEMRRRLAQMEAEKTTAAKRVLTVDEIRANEEAFMLQRLQGLIDASGKSNLIRKLQKSAAVAQSDEKVETCGVVRSKTENVTDAPPCKPVLPPPPPPFPAKGKRMEGEKVRRVPEVVEFYHSLMRRETKRECGGGGGEIAAGTNSRDMIGEIENRSSYLLAIKNDVETKGDFIRKLIGDVNNVSFKSIEDVLPFVKWLDEELSFLVDERAVLKHFEWPEKRADALREAAFGYSDLKKVESEASLFQDDPRQSCGAALKKIQALLEKLEHGAYNLSHLRESSLNKYRTHRIPADWMLETGLVFQIKMASVKLAMKSMKRVSAELETVASNQEGEELIVQGVKLAFRVHQFAGGFDMDTMKAFKQLKEKASKCHFQSHNQQLPASLTAFRGGTEQASKECFHI